MAANTVAVIRGRDSVELEVTVDATIFYTKAQRGD